MSYRITESIMSWDTGESSGYMYKVQSTPVHNTCTCMHKRTCTCIIQVQIVMYTYTCILCIELPWVGIFQTMTLCGQKFNN